MVELHPPDQLTAKVTRIRRLFKIEDRLADQLGIPPGDPRLRQSAVEKFRSERRAQVKDRRRRWASKWELLNENAFGEDIDGLLMTCLKDRSTMEEVPEDLDRMYLVHFDLQMLNYFNSLPSGHLAGDEYKRFMADTLASRTEAMQKWRKRQELPYRAYVIGGDEFAIFAKGGEEDVIGLARKVRDEVLSYHHREDDIHASGVDYGVMSLGDVLRMLKTLEFLEKFADYSVGDQRTLIRKLLLAAVDRVSHREKFVSRIRFLQEIYNDQRNDFERAYAFATKGAIQISQEELIKIFTSSAPEAEARVFVDGILTSRDEGALKRTSDPFEVFLYTFLRGLTRG